MISNERLIMAEDAFYGWDIGGLYNKVARELIGWSIYVSDDDKARRILNVAKRVEQRYRLAHGLPNMGV